MERMKLEKEQGPLELYGGNEGSGEEEVSKADLIITKDFSHIWCIHC